MAGCMASAFFNRSVCSLCVTNKCMYTSPRLAAFCSTEQEENKREIRLKGRKHGEMV